MSFLATFTRTNNGPVQHLSNDFSPRFAKEVMNLWLQIFDFRYYHLLFAVYFVRGLPTSECDSSSSYLLTAERYFT